MAGDLAAAVNALTSTGIAAYEVSQGAPVSASSTGGIPSYSVGSVLSGTSGTFIIIAIAAIVLVLVLKR